MDQLILVGAGGLAREVLGWMPGIKGFGSSFQVKGLLTDGDESLTSLGYTEPILGRVDDYAIQPEDVFFIAMGDCKTRLRYADALVSRGARFQTLIHQTVIVSRGSKIGMGSLLCPRVIISCDVTIGNHVILNCASGVGHDGIVGDGCTFSAYSEATGNVKLGRGVFLGSHASVLPKVKVGDFAVIGAGSTVIRNVASGATMIGVPASRLPTITD